MSRPPGCSRTASAFVFAIASFAATPARAVDPPAGDPDAYDPLLDRPATWSPPRAAPPRKPGASGFFVGGGGFLYAGRNSSRLEKHESKLENGTFPGVMLTFGGRARIPLEIGVDLGYGLGRAYSAEFQEWIWAHDLLLEPRALWHVWENERWDFAAGLAGSFWLFDIGADGISQTLIGPFGAASIRRHLDARSLLFCELSGGVGKDTLAYTRVDPTEEELALDPLAKPHREWGRWYPLVRISAGYRLSGF